uniref:Uncharacterized protein LOC114335712 n=1 Tax=Diabrotica virgifera virgifera TaxID=50390 RepID=A0A6P7FZ42_DIAVI
MTSKNCEICLAEFSENEKYQIRCHGDCKRYFCIKCSCLNKTTAKTLLDPKNSHLRFFCTLCDSPSLRYLNEKINNLSKNQIPQENFDALIQVTKKLTDNLPIFIETYDLLTKNDGKLDYITKKIDEIHKLNNLLNPEYLSKSIRQMGQNIFNISSVFFGCSNDTIKVQVQDSNSSEIKLGLDRLSSNVSEISNQMSNLSNKLPAIPTKKDVSKRDIVYATSSTQTEDTQHFEASPVTKSKSAEDKCHFVVISNLTPIYTPIQVVHYIKEKLGIKEYIRCYALLKDANTTTGSSFKIGIKSKTSIDLLFNKEIWPPGINIKWSTESSCSEPTTSSEANMKPKHIRSPVNLENSITIPTRLREPDILKAIKLHLAFLHDQPASVFCDGYTNTSVKLFLASEGLPTKTEELRKTLLEFNDAYGIGPAEVEADIAAY